LLQYQKGFEPRYGAFFYLWHIKVFPMNNEQQTELLKRITVVEGLMSGRPTIRALRFPVGDILELLASGMAEDEILAEHPILEKDDIAAALLYASLKVNNTRIVYAA
jgi:uncharacterized protein (DUF433 family)